MNALKYSTILMIAASLMATHEVLAQELPPPTPTVQNPIRQPASVVDRQEPAPANPSPSPGRPPSPEPSRSMRGNRSAEGNSSRDFSGENLLASGSLHLPYRIEVGGDNTGTSRSIVVTLAVGAATLVRCPEPVLQVIFGNKTGMGFTSSSEAAPRPDFYLRPTKAGLRTNLLIEMESSTVAMSLRTVAIKGGPQAGDYHGEVIVHPDNYKNELASAREQLEMQKKEAAANKTALADVPRKLAEAAQAGEDAGINASLSLLSGALGGGHRKVVSSGDVSLTLINQTARPNGRLWVLLALENKGKHLARIDGMALIGGKLLVLGKVPLVRGKTNQIETALEIAPRDLCYLILVAEPELPSATKGDPSTLALKLTIDGKIPDGG